MLKKSTTKMAGLFIALCMTLTLMPGTAFAEDERAVDNGQLTVDNEGNGETETSEATEDSGEETTTEATDAAEPSEDSMDESAEDPSEAAAEAAPAVTITITGESEYGDALYLDSGVAVTDTMLLAGVSAADENGEAVPVTVADVGGLDRENPQPKGEPGSPEAYIITYAAEGAQAVTRECFVTVGVMPLGNVSDFAALQADCDTGSGDVVLTADILDGTSTLNINRDLTLDLAGHKLTISISDVPYMRAAVMIANGATLTIKDSFDGGTLTASNNGPAATATNAGINVTNGALVIESGTVEASGGTSSAGIGGGRYGSGGNITINGGTVIATGGNSGAGIGGGYGGDGGNITINGGSVTARAGGGPGAGIGGGSLGGSGNITITGGTVAATSVNSGAGIGSEYSRNGGSIIITGGNITVTNERGGVAIGAVTQEGSVDSGVTISISGATVNGTPTDDLAPQLTVGTVTRDSETTATVDFTCDSVPGSYYYQISETPLTANALVSGAMNETPLIAGGTNTIRLSSLPTGAHTLYLVAKGADVYAGAVITVAIPEYKTGSLSITYNNGDDMYTARYNALRDSGMAPADVTGIVVTGNATEIVGYEWTRLINMFDELWDDGGKGWTGLEFLDLSAMTSLKEISADYRIMQRPKLKNIELPDGITNIGAEAFANCTNLEINKLPDSVSSIGSGAFASCDGINELVFTQIPAPTVGADAFDGVTATIYYPAGATGYTLADFGGAGDLTFIPDSAPPPPPVKPDPAPEPTRPAPRPNYERDDDNDGDSAYSAPRLPAPTHTLRKGDGYYDTMLGRTVEVRLYADWPVSGYTSGADVTRVRGLFEKWFTNPVRAIHFEQAGKWEQPVKVAAKVDLAGMDTTKLVIYYYDPKLGIYRRLTASAYWIDANGYLHFTTEYAGEIVIAEGELEKREKFLAGE